MDKKRLINLAYGVLFATLIGYLAYVKGWIFPNFDSITPQAAYEKLQEEESPLLIDVRTPQEYNEGHIEGSLLIPLDTLEANLPKLANSKDRPLIVYCRSGARSAIASRLLADQGFKPLNVSGGINEWSAAKLPLAKP
jgi:rhodanese-related sulfurtransferase